MAGPENPESHPVTGEYLKALRIVKQDREDRREANLTGGYIPSPEYLALNPALRIRAGRVIFQEELRKASQRASGRKH